MAIPFDEILSQLAPERRAGMDVSTLRKLLRAMGGEFDDSLDLLEPEGLDRVEPRGLPCGIVAENHADGGRDRDRGDDRE
jgi:hypothetical protein